MRATCSESGTEPGKADAEDQVGKRQVRDELPVGGQRLQVREVQPGQVGACTDQLGEGGHAGILGCRAWETRGSGCRTRGVLSWLPGCPAAWTRTDAICWTSPPTTTSVCPGTRQ